MGGIFLAPTEIAQPPSDPFIAPPQCNRMFWHGFDGSVWDIGDRHAGVRLGAGVRGLTMPDVDWFTSDSAGVDGTQDRGWRVLPRDVFWPLRVYQVPAAQAWNDFDTTFWRTLYPGRYGEWEVIQPGRSGQAGESRRLRVRLEGDGAQAFDTDPALIGWARYGVSLFAPDPYWTSSQPIQRDFAAGTSRDFFNGGHAPPFYISSSSTISSAGMPNPGDVPAWPVWTIFGPTTSVDVGIGSAQIQVHFPVAAGKAVVIDTDPRQRTAMDATVVATPDGPAAVPTGDDLFGLLGTTDWAQIPTGAMVTLNLAMVGAGSVRALVKPRWFRAW